MPEAELLEAGVEPWVHLPLWLPADVARTAWDVDTSRAREWGLPSRPVVESVADTWAWQQANPRPPMQKLAHRTEPGLPPELEAKLLASADRDGPRQGPAPSVRGVGGRGSFLSPAVRSGVRP